jgi:hypothetical protein
VHAGAVHRSRQVPVLPQVHAGGAEESGQPMWGHLAAARRAAVPDSCDSSCPGTRASWSGTATRPWSCRPRCRSCTGGTARGHGRVLLEQQEERVQPRGRHIRAPRLRHGRAGHGHVCVNKQQRLQPRQAARADQERVPPLLRTHLRRERVARQDAHQQLLTHPEQRPGHRPYAPTNQKYCRTH